MNILYFSINLEYSLKDAVRLLMPAANPDQRNKILLSLNLGISREITNPCNKQVLNFESFISSNSL